MLFKLIEYDNKIEVYFFHLDNHNIQIT